MIGKTVRELLLIKQDSFIIPDEKVAHVMAENPLNHALLVLTKVRYSKIPVLDREGHYIGLIGLNDVVEEMLAVEGIIPDRLNDSCVKDVMDTSQPAIRIDTDIEYILHLMVDYPFLPVTDEAGIFIGIITRKEILKAVNQLVHTLESRYDIRQKPAATE